MHNLIKDFGEQYRSYLSDESKLRGVAKSISFPKSEDDIIYIINNLRNKEETITIQGNRTGLVGSAVPFSNHVINLSEFKEKIEIFDKEEVLLRTSSGFTLEEIYSKIRMSTKGKYFLPIEPSEKTATIGGVIAQNAKGLTSHKYGGVIDYIKQIKVINYLGEISVLDNKEDIEIYIGSEGMYGVILEAVFKLVKRPENIWTIVLFFNDKYSAINFAEEICGADESNTISLVEYLDFNSIRLLQEYKPQISSIKDTPDIPSDVKSMIILELSNEHEKEIESFVEKIMVIIESYNCDLDISWALTGELEANKIRNLRHAIVEIVNMEIATINVDGNLLHRVDVNIFGDEIIESLVEIEDKMINSNIDYCVYGHVGDMSLIISMIPKDSNQNEKVREIITKFIYSKVYDDSTEIYEFGIGKINSKYYLISSKIEEKKKSVDIKKKFDPKGIFNPYNRMQTNIEIIKNEFKGCKYE